MKFQNPSFKYFLNGRTNKRTNGRTDERTDKPKAICSPLFQSRGHKNFGGWGGGCWVVGSDWGGVRVDVNEELKFLGKFKKKIGGGGQGGVGSRGGCWVGGGFWGQGGCE